MNNECHHSLSPFLLDNIPPFLMVKSHQAAGPSWGLLLLHLIEVDSQQNLAERPGWGSFDFEMISR